MYANSIMVALPNISKIYLCGICGNRTHSRVPVQLFCLLRDAVLPNTTIHNAHRYNDDEYIVQYLDAALFVANIHLHHPTYCDTYGTRTHDLRRDRAAF